MTSPDQTPRIVAKKSARMQFLSSTLILEAIVVLFGTVVAVKFVQADRLDAPTSTLWIMGGLLSLIMIIISRVQKSSYGIIAGCAVQVPFVAMGFYVDMMFFVATVFVGLWVASLWLGTKIDRERAEYDSAHPTEAPNA